MNGRDAGAPHAASGPCARDAAPTCEPRVHNVRVMTSDSRAVCHGQTIPTRVRAAWRALAVLATALAAPATAMAAPWVAPGHPGTTDLLVQECLTGRTVAATRSPHALTARPVFAADGRALYAATDAGELLRYSLPELRVEAQVTLGYTATALAVGHGPDAVVLAGGRGTAALSAHDPGTLAALHRYRLPSPYTVADVHDVPTRGRFVVAFADLREAWEIAYDRAAPPVLQGLVHDYRSNEAIPLPGRFTPRRFELPTTTRALIAGPAAYEVARIDDTGALGIVHLDVRREIERPRLATAALPERVGPWGRGAQRGLLVAGSGAHRADVLAATEWQVREAVDVGGEILALARFGPHALVAAARADDVAVLRIDMTNRPVVAPLTTIAAAPPPLRFVAGTEGCVALVDGKARWRAGFAAAP